MLTGGRARRGCASTVGALPLRREAEGAEGWVARLLLRCAATICPAQSAVLHKAVAAIAGGVEGLPTTPETGIQRVCR
jgi:hypothetical protein